MRNEPGLSNDSRNEFSIKAWTMTDGSHLTDESKFEYSTKTGTMGNDDSSVECSINVGTMGKSP